MSNGTIIEPGGKALGTGLRRKLQEMLTLGPLGLVRKILSQSTLRATIVFAFSGLAFALGNLLLARTMPVHAFGELSLAIALFNVFGLLTPIGVDQVMLRHQIDPGPRLLMFLSGCGITLGGIIGFGYSDFTHLPLINGLVLGIGIAAGGVIATLASLARARHLEFAAMTLVTVASWVLLLIGLASLLFPMHQSFLPLGLFALGNLLAATIGWHKLSRANRVHEAQHATIPWGEALSLLGIAAIGTIMLQLERLIIPPTIGITALALFSVLASVAIFPFRLLTASAGFALVPKLRAATSLQEKHRLVKREMLAIMGLLLFASLGIALLSPIATEILTGGRYHLSTVLVIAACFNGYAKVIQSFPRALITACGTDKDIAHLNRLGWVGLLTSLLGAFIGAEWGLEGLLYGVAIGSLAGTLPATLLAERKLR